MVADSRSDFGPAPAVMVASVLGAVGLFWMLPVVHEAPAAHGTSFCTMSNELEVALVTLVAPALNVSLMPKRVKASAEKVATPATAFTWEPVVSNAGDVGVSLGVSVIVTAPVKVVTTLPHGSS